MAVYSNLEVARRVTEAKGWDNDPEEIELDPEVPEEIRGGYTYYAVSMFKNGDTRSVYKAEGKDFELQVREYQNTYYKRGLPDTLYTFYVVARDKEHAIKIANERRIIKLSGV